MVDSKNVIFFPAGRKAFYPPGIAVFFLFFPVINGVSPKLAVFGKIIRRNSRNVSGVSFLIKIKKFRICPNVAAVIRNINRKVADYFYSAFVGVIFKIFPLDFNLFPAFLSISRFFVLPAQGTLIFSAFYEIVRNT